MYRTGILIMSDKGAAGEREDRGGANPADPGARLFAGILPDHPG